MVGIYPVLQHNIDKNTIEEGEDNNLILVITAEEFLHKELGFRLSQIVEMKILSVKKSKMIDSKTLYISFENEASVSLIFQRAALVQNNLIKISNFIPPQLYDRYSCLASKC